MTAASIERGLEHTAASIADLLTEARDRTIALLEPLNDAELIRQHSPLMSPLVWDFAHIANFEELWLVRALGGDALAASQDDTYDALAHPRIDRPSLDLLDPPGARKYCMEVRERSLELLCNLDVDALAKDSSNALLRNAFIYGMVIQHEHQHAETMLATFNLRDTPYEGERPRSLRRVLPEQSGELLITGGLSELGTDEESWAYDNERPMHRVSLDPFRIDRAPVTNAAFAEFMADGGYTDERLWSTQGWEWLQGADLDHPLFWTKMSSDTWSRKRLGHVEDLPPDEPVCHVCWFEADAYARWLGKRLPNEAEWECASGRLELVGEVWEWTSSGFAGYPGFVAFPYPEYSQSFFNPGGETSDRSMYNVLRGASWATHPILRRPTFRNWDFPIRRQIFSGIRCASDA